MKGILILAIGLLSIEIKAQCSSSGAINAGTIIPTTSWQTITQAAGTQYYYLVNVATCNTYTFSFCQGSGTSIFDTQITITDNTSGTTYYGYNDDKCGMLSELVWTPTTSGTYRILISQYSCTNPTASATLAYIYGASNTVNINYALNGNATSSSPYDCTILTTATNNQLGCAWTANSTLDFTYNFTYDFIVNLGSSTTGADGMTFTIQNDPRGLCACGTSGNQMGAGTISNSLIVEIDTYINTEDRDDFTGADYIGCNGTLDPDHIDIWTNGVVNPDLDYNCNTTSAGERPCIPWAIPLKNGNNYYNIDNGLNHIMRITWTSGLTGTLTISILDNAGVTTYGTASYSFNPLTVFGTNTPYFGFTASTGGLNNQQSFCNPTSLLPIEIASFDAVKENNSAKLNWTTATETNNKYFSIERSTDGENWNSIGKQNSKAQHGNSIKSLDYIFYDTHLSPGINYYRLKQIDYNGKYSYSGIRTVEYDEHITPIVFPNPFENNFNVNVLSPTSSTIEYKIYNSLGQLVLQEKQTQGQAGNFAKQIEITKGVGVYYLVLSVNEERYTYKLVCNK